MWRQDEGTQPDEGALTAFVLCAKKTVGAESAPTLQIPNCREFYFAPGTFSGLLNGYCPCEASRIKLRSTQA